jgi:zinc transporter ZupT
VSEAPPSPRAVFPGQMTAWIAQLDPVLQALIAGGFTWLLTAAGAATVFVRRDIPAGVLDAMLGFTVMMILDVALG